MLTKGQIVFSFLAAAGRDEVAPGSFSKSAPSAELRNNIRGLYQLLTTNRSSILNVKG